MFARRDKSSRPIKIVITGGGTAGHVMPHLAMLPEMRRRNWSIRYIGSRGMEMGIAAKAGIAFTPIVAGKLRRYFSWENFTDVLKVFLGTAQAFLSLLRDRPDVVFSKGGFVSVPVAAAAWLLRIPVVSHESDLTPGLANRIIMRFARTILHSFPETGKHLPAGKGMWSGAPVRTELFHGDRVRGLAMCGFEATDASPVVMVMGGSQGAQRINDAFELALPELTKAFRVVHLTGKGKSLKYQSPRYKGFEFVSEELPDLFSITDLVVSRSGGAIFEFLELSKPMLLIPLVVGSRGDQVLNASVFVDNGWARVVTEDSLTGEILRDAIADVWRDSAMIRKAQESYQGRGAAIRIVDCLESVTRA